MASALLYENVVPVLALELFDEPPNTEEDQRIEVAVTAKPGDVVVHHAETIHSAKF